MMRHDAQRLLQAIGLCCLGAACSSLPAPPDQASLHGEPEQVTLYVHPVSTPVDPAHRDRTTLVIPGASWLEADLEPLAAARPTVFYDMRGRGRSSLIPTSDSMRIANDVADLEALRSKLGLESMCLMGWAYGAQVITRYALQHPERVEGLVLVGPLPPRRSGFWPAYLASYGQRLRPEEQSAIEELRERGIKAKNPERYCRSVQEASLRTFVHDPAVLKGMRTRPWVLPNLDPELAARHAQAILKDLGDWNWLAELEQLQRPVLVIHGEHELLPLASSRAYVEALPKAELFLLGGAAHMPWLEQPESFFTAVNAFLSGAALQQDLTGDTR